jgi:hypothetical protein
MRKPKPYSDTRLPVLEPEKRPELNQPYATETEDYSGGKIVSPHTQALDRGERNEKRPRTADE